MPALEFAFVALFAVAWPLYEWRVGYPRMLRALERGAIGARADLYRRTMAEQWSFAAVAVILWTLPGRSLAALGLGLPHPARFAAGLALTLGIVALLVAQGRAVLRRPAMLERVRAQLGAAAPLVPHTPEESRFWQVLCLTAGVCEEVLFRGFLVAWFTPWTGPIPAWTLSVVLFGMAHVYLGRTGALRAGLAGIFMAGLYAFTGSLWAPMLLHAAVDMHSGRLGFAAMSAGPASAAAVPAAG